MNLEPRSCSNDLICICFMRCHLRWMIRVSRHAHISYNGLRNLFLLPYTAYFLRLCISEQRYFVSLFPYASLECS